MNVSTSKKTLTGVAGAAAVLIAAVAVAAHGGSDRATAATAPAPASVPSEQVSSGLVVSRDAATGELRAPTAEEYSELQALRPRTTKGSGSVMRTRRDGTIEITLDSSTEMNSIAVKQADGKIVTACVPGERVQATLDAAQKQSQTTTTNQVLDEK